MGRRGHRLGPHHMHDVQQAFRDSPDVAAFEKRVNEIYEGDWLVLVRASVTRTGCSWRAGRT